MVLKNEKKLLRMEDVKMIKVPCYEELSVKALYPQAKEDHRLSLYLPDIRDKGKPLERTFFFNILNTIESDYVSHLIE